jgi:hypothetical protein
MDGAAAAEESSACSVLKYDDVGKCPALLVIARLVMAGAVGLCS